MRLTMARMPSCGDVNRASSLGMRMSEARCREPPSFTSSSAGASSHTCSAAGIGVRRQLKSFTEHPDVQVPVRCQLIRADV